MSATYPNVPIAPGVPPVFRAATDALVLLDRLTRDAPGLQGSLQPQWGVFDAQGRPVIVPDSVVGVEHMRDFRISNFPVESGGFESYNKVATPAESRVIFAKGGTPDERTAFLAEITAAVESLDLYTVTTPEVSYNNANLVRYDYRRHSDRGATLLLVEVVLEEVRVAPSQVFTNSKSPSGARSVSTGQVQAQVPTLVQTPPAPFVAKASIPLLSTAAQTLSVVLGAQACLFDIYEKAAGLYVDVTVGGSPLVAGVAALNLTSLVRSSYLGFVGDLYFYDTFKGGADPTFAGLGNQFALLWSG